MMSVASGVSTPVRSRIEGHSATGSSTGRPSSVNSPSILNGDQLKEHYATCIKLSANNKITGRNAFSLHLIDYMSHLLRSDAGTQAMNFKLATSALDAGTKIYVSRVDSVHCDAQRVADGIVQALDNKGRKGTAGQSGQDGEDVAIDENGEVIDQNDSNQDLNDENEGPRVKKSRKKKKGKTIASYDSITVSKVESNVEIDPIFHKLTTSYDMANVNSLLLGNLNANDQNRLILDSNAVIDKFGDVKKPRTRVNGVEDGDKENVADHDEGCTGQDGRGDTNTKKAGGKIFQNTDASEIEPVLKDVLEKQYKLFDDPFFRSFSFTNRETSLGDMSYRRDADESRTGNNRPSAFTFDLNAEIEPDTEPVNTDAFHLDDGDFVSVRGSSMHGSDSEDENTVQIDENGHIIPKPDPHAHQSMIKAFNLENFEELKNLLSDNREYSYFTDRIKNSWAGPSYWKLDPFHRVKQAKMNQQGTGGGQPGGRFDLGPQSTRKAKKTYETLDFNMNLVIQGSLDKPRGRKNRSNPVDPDTIIMSANFVGNDIKLRVSTLVKWQQISEKLLLPERQDYDASQLFKCGLKDCMFSCVRFSGFKFGSSQSGSQTGSVVLEGPTKDAVTDALNEYEELECPDDDGFPMESQPFTISADPGLVSAGNSQVPTVNPNGLELIEEPHAIQTIQLPFSKYAKRIDVKKLKRVMIDMIKHPETVNLNQVTN